MGTYETPRGTPYATPSDQPKIPPSTDSLLDPSIFTGSLQALTSSFKPKALPSSVPF